MTEPETNPPSGDYWPTPMKAVLPLLPFLMPRTRFFEPCAGNGALIDHLAESEIYCHWAGDIAPQRDDISLFDAIDHANYLRDKGELYWVDCIITNPPYSRKAMLRLLDGLPNFKPCWFLLQAGFLHNKYFTPLMPSVKKIVSVGRIKWVKNSKHKSTKDFVWVLMDKTAKPQTPTFHKT